MAGLSPSCPVADWSGVDVHEAASGVVSYAAAAQEGGESFEVFEFGAGEVDVYGACFDVKAVFRDAFAFFAQHGVGFGGAVAGEYFEGFVGIAYELYGVEEVEEFDVHLLYVAGAEVAQKVVDACEFFRDVVVFCPVGGFEVLSCVGVVEFEFFVNGYRESEKLIGGECESCAQDDTFFQKVSSVVHRSYPPVLCCSDEDIGDL